MGDLQKINISDEFAVCSNCGANILDIANFKYEEKCETGPKYREEVNSCKKCGTQFILRYDLFDQDGHIHPRVFSEDPNDPKYNWTDILTKEQKEVIATHLKDCPICNKRLESELELDVWFSSILHNKGK
jgi:uncharacterized protein with PIN domain